MQHPVSDAVVTDVAVGIQAVEQCHLRLSVLFIPIHWKTLGTNIQTIQSGMTSEIKFLTVEPIPFTK